MNCLLVTAHPLDDSLCRHLTTETIAHLNTRGYEIVHKDLYQEQFEPRLTPNERRSYYSDTFHSDGLAGDIEQLEQAESLVLIFPTWWFSFPAILKGWFDRVWVPGHAYDHATDLGAIQPRLHKLREMHVITTLGSPWWVDYFVLQRPVKKVLQRALLGTCTRNCRFSMLSLYKSEQLSQSKVQAFVEKIRASL